LAEAALFRSGRSENCTPDAHRSWVTERLVPLITPTSWAIGLWISVAVAERAGWPHLVTQTVFNLLVAWLVIRLAAALVPYAALARLIAVLAWVVAALIIMHLLGPTLDFLDSVAIAVSVLRISILTVVRGVLSLAMLLWAASVASNLFERRITQFSQRRLLGNGRRLLRCEAMRSCVYAGRANNFRAWSVL
jgi:hypothetical protein